MKLDKNDNRKLIMECCIVREMQAKLNNRPEHIEKYEALRKSILENKNIDFDTLHQQFDESIAIRNFLNQMQKYRKSTINRDYYQQAVAIAKESFLRDDPWKTEEFNEKLKNQFFSEKRIEGLKTRLDKHNQSKRFIAVGAPILALVAAGGIALGIANNNKSSEKIEPSTTIESTATPTPTQEPTTGIADLDTNDKDFYDKVAQDFKKRYAEQYNISHEKPISIDDFVVMPQESQDYIWQLKFGDATIYMSHGDENYIQSTEQYLKENHIKAKDIHDCKSVSIYAAKNGERIKDANGSYIKLDSIVQFTDPETEDLETAYLFDGNHIKEDVFQNYELSADTTLLNLSESAFTLSYCNSNKELKENYLKAVGKESSQLAPVDCGFENEIDKQLEEKDLER